MPDIVDRFECSVNTETSARLVGAVCQLGSAAVALTGLVGLVVPVALALVPLDGRCRRGPRRRARGWAGEVGGRRGRVAADAPAAGSGRALGIGVQGRRTGRSPRPRGRPRGAAPPARRPSRSPGSAPRRRIAARTGSAGGSAPAAPGRRLPRPVGQERGSQPSGPRPGSTGRARVHRACATSAADGLAAADGSSIASSTTPSASPTGSAWCGCRSLRGDERRGRRRVERGPAR